MAPREPNGEWQAFASRQTLRLTGETGAALRIRGFAFEENLQGDVPIELRIACAIYLAHPAGTHQRQNLVGTEPGAWSKSHEIVEE